MPRPRAKHPTLTTKAVEAATKQAAATGKPVTVWDGLVLGFGARCLPTGRVAWF